MSKLRILLLGAPEVKWNDKPYAISRRTSRALLFYLAGTSEPVLRGDLMLTFWPDLDERSARANLRDHLGKLRASLPNPEMIIANLDTVQINHDLVEVDLTQFQSLIQSMGRLPWQIPANTPLPDHLYRTMVSAVSLWRLPHFMQGLPVAESTQMEEWVSENEQKLLVIRRTLIQRLIDHAEASNDYLSLLNWIRLALESDPYNEDLHMRLMNGLVLAGNRTEAIHHGQRTAQLLKKELGEQPSQELLDLLVSIQKENRKNDLSRYQLKNAATGLTTTFVGREEELRLMALAEQQGKVVLLRGETGIGKTRLVYEYYRQSGHPYHMLIAPCQKSTSGIPYQPFINMIRNDIHLLEQANLTVEDRQKFLSIDSSLSPIFPRESEESRGEEFMSPSSVLDLFGRFFKGLYSKFRILLLVDDVQWMDGASNNLIKSLILNKLVPTKIFLVATCDQSKNNPGTAGLMTYLDELGIAQKITVPPLKEDEVRLLASNLSQSQLPEDGFSALVRDTNGNPLLAIETIRSALFYKNDTQDSGNRVIVPGSIRALFRERLHQLTALHRQILFTGAVIGTHFDMDLIETISQLSSEDTVDGLEDLERMGILKVLLDSPHHRFTYTFSQNIFREVVLLEMSEARKRLLHRRVARAIEQTSPNPDEVLSAILAEHYSASGDFATAFKYWCRAAAYARRVASPQDAYRAYQRAEQLRRSIDIQLSDTEIKEMYLSWGTMAYQIQDIPTVQKIGKELFLIGEDRSSHTLMGCGLLLESMARFGEHDYLVGLNICDQALRYLREGNDKADILKGITRKAKFLYMLTRFQESKQILEEGLQLLSDDMDVGMISAASMLYYDYSILLTLTGYPYNGLAMAEKSHQYCIQVKDLESEVKVFGQLILANVYCCENVKAEQEAEIGLSHAEKVQYTRMTAYILAYRAIAREALGKMDSAWESAHQAMEISEKNPFPEVTSVALRTCGDIHRYLLDYSRAVEYYTKGFEVHGDKLVRFDHLARNGYLTGLMGDKTLGLKMLEEAYRCTSELGIGSVKLSARLYTFMLQDSLEELDRYSEEMALVYREAYERRLMTQCYITELIQTRRLFLLGDIDTGNHLLESTLHKAHQMDGLWPQLIYQHILLGSRGKIPDMTILQWKQILLQRLEKMAIQCCLDVTKPIFLRFLDAVDKI
jgi:DNA-binding SARP family transcriptional activator